ncbi:MAG: hypothetical protein BMS9Abin34_438 [Patescibacteria group bacterium]|nr:MAG: hypothetical protein BMS9Abin34_438 [Patescibacteria group bacterium]
MATQNNQPVTIVMYHYVRDLTRTRYPRIRGLTTQKFEGQLDYIAKHYTVVGLQKLFSDLQNGIPLPTNPCVLSFDDGLADHYHTVFPRLAERGIVGSFYPPAKAPETCQVLDVHKVHFILASSENAQQLVGEIFGLLQHFRKEHEIPSDEELYERYARRNRFDPPEIIFIKRILQRGLPENVRREVVSRLFAHHVSNDEKAFAKELYMDPSQLRVMLAAGMEVGGHGYDHVWLGTLDRNGQREEIFRTVSFLTKVLDINPINWAMSYPYGSYNSITIELLKEAGCALGLTSQVGLAKLSKPMHLSRLDTNDLPFSGDAPVSGWTKRINPYSP